MYWIEEDIILSGVKGKEIKEKVVLEKFLLRKVIEEDVEELVIVFGKVFEVYLIFLNEVSYVL